ncbi:Poly(A)-specific ribonuclease PARN [Cytospora mali]|uniref:Poly(A)-specific ribonuclease PARN n=1 Tax=Cytospora mali TaxID=578113 RepID=A0A194V7D6_CYTMA|nr:Poly(A)-specific ribonuclease PARN [Valsa mali var. pyri (nom. inval.)]
MDIDRASFWPKLPSILKAISEAQFVSVDLEMSGITVKTVDSTPKLSLQQTYKEAKLAAETFAILQFGLTCIRWEPEREAYVTKTFNLPVHPGFVGEDGASKQLARTVDRCVKLSTKSIAFLQEHGFSFADIFDKGIPYLSTTEAAQKDIMDLIEDKDQREDHIDLSQLPPQARDFYSSVQARLKQWTNKGLYEADTKPLRIENPHGGRVNNLQKRLIYQLLEVEFKSCRAYNRAGSAYMEVVNMKAKFCRVSDRPKAQRKQAVVKQTGLRFLWDAICGRLFADKIYPGLVVGEDPVKIIQLQRDLKEYERRLRNQSPIFVGHNLLWDLCFLHSTFVGSLPEKVGDFTTIMRERLPRIVDTKYLFTRGGHEMLPDQNLTECFSAVNTEKYPVVQPDPLYSYLTPRPHQAGYDSEPPPFTSMITPVAFTYRGSYQGYMTAVVLIKKSCQLFQAKQGLEFIPAEDYPDAIVPSRSGPTLTMGSSPHLLPRPSPLPFQASHHIPTVPSAFMGPRSHRTNSLLDDDDGDGTLVGLTNYTVLKPEVSSALATQETKPVGSAKVPAWGGAFWKRYGNKSRVGPFGLILYTGKQ